MDTSIETLMRQYTKTTENIKMWEKRNEQIKRDIDVLTRKIRPQKWLNKVDVIDPMFQLYTKKLELIAEYDKNNERLERLKLSQSLQFNLINNREFRM